MAPYGVFPTSCYRHLHSCRDIFTDYKEAHGSKGMGEVVVARSSNGEN